MGPECCQPMLSLTAGQPLTSVMGLSPGGGMDKALALGVSGGQGTGSFGCRSERLRRGLGVIPWRPECLLGREKAGILGWGNPDDACPALLSWGGQRTATLQA